MVNANSDVISAMIGTSAEVSVNLCKSVRETYLRHSLLPSYKEELFLIYPFIYNNTAKIQAPQALLR